MKYRNLMLAGLAVVLAGLLAELPNKSNSTPVVEQTVEVKAETKKEEKKEAEPAKVAVAKNKPAPKTEKQLRSELTKANPKKCNLTTQIALYPTGECKDKKAPVAVKPAPKPTVAAKAAPKPAPKQVAKAAPQAAPAGVPSGSCAAEISKYNWNQSVATSVARAESGLNPGAVNFNHATRDHSIGCFQINIYGANARTRPSKAALMNASTNVAFAYKIYTSNGNSFRGQWGVCRKISCY